MRSLPTVLVVDADPAARRAAAAALPSDRYRVIYADGVDAARQLLADEPVSVLVVEIVLPGPSGLSVLVEARHAHPAVARVVLTGAAELDAAVKSINQAEVLRFLCKPLAAAEMRAAVDDGLAWAEAAGAAHEARAAAARRRAGLNALAADHPGLVAAAAGPDGYGIPPHRVASLAARLAATPLGAVLARALPGGGA